MPTPFVPNLSTAMIKNEVPVGALNGVNVTFTLANKPAPNTLIVFKKGARLIPTTDYTLAGNVITVVVAPADATEPILADYDF